jgi:hypothetical protein
MAEVLRAANCSFSSFDGLHVITPKVRGATHGDVYFLGGLAIAAMSDDSVRMRAAYVIYDHESHSLAWSADRVAFRGSALEEQMLSELLAEFRAALPIALSVYADLVGTPE